MSLDPLDRRIVNALQEPLPLVPAPYAEVAARLGIEEEALLARLEQLLTERVLTRFGPFFNAEAMGGAFCLCAMAVPAERFEEVAAIVNAMPEVAHNYARGHRLNMWFVLATERAGDIARLADEIEAATGLPVLRLPKLKEFFVGFRVAA